MECRLDDITVYYEAYGAGRPLIMIHGWSIDHHPMVAEMEPIFGGREGWQRIYLDLPGHGRTPGRPWITNQDRMLEVVLDFIDAVIPGQRFAVAGASLGAYLARGVVYRKAAQVDGLLLTVPVILADTALRTRPPRVALVQDPALATELGPDEAGVLDLLVVQTREVVDALRPATPRRVRRATGPFRPPSERTPPTTPSPSMWMPYPSPSLRPRSSWPVGRTASSGTATPGASWRATPGPRLPCWTAPATAWKSSKRACSTPW